MPPQGRHFFAHPKKRRDMESANAGTANNTAGAAPERGAPTFAVETVVALLVLALGITVLWGSWHLGSGWTTDGPGPGYFPFYIGLILCISAAGILFQAIRKHDVSVFVDGAQLRQVL